MVDGHSMNISDELFSIDQVDFDKKIFKVIPVFTQERKLVSSPGGYVFQPIKMIWTFLAVRHPMIIYAKSFSNPSVSISHDATGLSVVVPDHTHLLFLTRRLV